MCLTGESLKQFERERERERERVLRERERVLREFWESFERVL